MARISDLLARGRTLSFEFYAPRDFEGQERLKSTLPRLAEVRPAFASITYGAGGAQRGPTWEWVRRIPRDHGITAVPHLTCVTHTRQEIAAIVDVYRGAGVENLLALRGDPPQNSAEPIRSDFTTAAELAAYVRRLASFDIGVAAHPEGHPLAPSQEADLAHQASKIRDADFAVTQFSFIPDHLRLFIERLRSKGVEAPIICGILPPTNLASVERMSRMNKVELPDDLCQNLKAAGESPTARREVGVDWGIKIAEGALRAGAAGVHLYTMNFWRAAYEVAIALDPDMFVALPPIVIHEPEEQLPRLQTPPDQCSLCYGGEDGTERLCTPAGEYYGGCDCGCHEAAHGHDPVFAAPIWDTSDVDISSNGSSWESVWKKIRRDY